MTVSDLARAAGLLAATLLLLGLAPSAALAATADAGGTFSDVDGSIFEAEIEQLAAAGITRGCGDGTRFCPDDHVTRGQLAAFLVRALDLPPGSATFTDTAGHVFERDVAALADAGITRGCGDGRFCPDAPVTRGQVAAFLQRALDLPPAAAVFTDTCGHVFEQDVEAVRAAGITRGCGDGTRFCPDDLVTRGQLAALLVRAGLADGDAVAPPPPPDDPPATDDGRCDSTPITSREGFLVAGGSSATVGVGTLHRYTVEIEPSLVERQDLGDLADAVDRTLLDTDRGWTAAGPHRLHRIDDPGRASFRLLLATPATVDRLCARAGLRTVGRYSCWNGRFAAINADRWFGGVDHVPDLGLYRRYVINHEAGHALGYGHRSCPGPGRLAPVMMQLTKSTYGCVPNAWPAP